MKKYNGFSLLEIMVVAAMLGGLALVGMQLMKNQQDATVFAEAKNEELSLMRNLQMALVKKQVCQKTFANKKVGEIVDAIISSDDQTLYQLNAPINGILKITSFETTESSIPPKGGYGAFNLIVGIQRLKKGVGTKELKKTLTIQAEFDEHGMILQCYSDVDSSIKTAKIEMCESFGGSFIDADNRCQLNAVFSNSDKEVVSKALLDQIVTGLRQEFDQKLEALKNAKSPADVNLDSLDLKSLSSCDGPSVRFRYKEPHSSNCQKELQYRLCEEGKWSEWSGSFTYPECN